MRSELEKQFLAALADKTKGRCAYSATDYEKALPHLQGLIDDGLVKERRLGLLQGFQITPEGRAYLYPTGGE
jgi:hypothetical protein